MEVAFQQYFTPIPQGDGISGPQIAETIADFLREHSSWEYYRHHLEVEGNLPTFENWAIGGICAGVALSLFLQLQLQKVESFDWRVVGTLYNWLFVPAITTLGTVCVGHVLYPKALYKALQSEGQLAERDREITPEYVAQVAYLLSDAGIRSMASHLNWDQALAVLHRIGRRRFFAQALGRLPAGVDRAMGYLNQVDGIRGVEAQQLMRQALSYRGFVDALSSARTLWQRFDPNLGRLIESLRFPLFFNVAEDHLPRIDNPSQLIAQLEQIEDDQLLANADGILSQIPLTASQRERLIELLCQDGSPEMNRTRARLAQEIAKKPGGRQAQLVGLARSHASVSDLLADRIPQLIERRGYKWDDIYTLLQVAQELALAQAVDAAIGHIRTHLNLNNVSALYRFAIENDGMEEDVERCRNFIRDNRQAAYGRNDLHDGLVQVRGEGE